MGYGNTELPHTGMQIDWIFGLGVLLMIAACVLYSFLKRGEG